MRYALAVAAAAAVLSLPQVAFAQSVEGGIKGGINVANVPQLAGFLEGEGFTDLQPRLGIIAGGFVTIHFGDYLAIQPEIMWAQKGLAGMDPELDDRVEVRFEYIDVPVLLRVQSSSDRGVYALFGPQFGFNREATFHHEAFGEEDIKDEIEETNVDVVAAVGYQGASILVEGRYTEGLTDSAKELNPTESYRNRTFSVLVGFRIR